MVSQSSGQLWNGSQRPDLIGNPNPGGSVSDRLNAYFNPAAFSKPAVDASTLDYEVRKGYLKTGDALDKLKQSLTGLLAARAVENIALVRETGRRQTAEFVERWLMKSFADGQQYPVKGYFPVETPPDGSLPKP